MKQRVKRVISLLVAAVMVCGLLALTGCGGGEDEKQVVTITVKTPTLQLASPTGKEKTTRTLELLQIASDAFKAQYKDAEVDFNLVEFEQTSEDKEVTECFDTPDAADVLYEGYFNMSTYIHTGRVVPLDDIISDELRADIPQSYWDSSMLDGKTYMMPYLAMQNTLSFNVDLFRQAGLDKFISKDPQKMQNWTREEWEEVLAALKKNLPDTVSPLMMYAGDNQGDTHIMTLLRCCGSSFYDENGRFHVNTPEGIAALQWIKDCNDKGYFPKGADTLVIMDNYNQFINGMLAMYMNNDAQEVTCRSEGGFDIQSVNFPNFASKDGKGLATTFITGFEVFDNGDEAKLAVARDFVKFIYESDFIDYMASSIPCSTKVAEKYAEDLKDIAKYVNNSDANWNFTGNNPNWRGVREAFYPNIQDLLFGEKTPEEVAASIDETCNAAIEEGYASSKLHE